MNGFGFIEYDDALDARDVVPGELPYLSTMRRPDVTSADAFDHSFPYAPRPTLSGEARIPLIAAYMKMVRI